MKLNEYQSLAMRTAKDMGSLDKNLLHVALGITSDAGELADNVKKYVVYGGAYDGDNLIEELGDCLWFIALGAKTLGLPLEDIARYNVEKLKKRYPNGYNDVDAFMRWDKVDKPVVPVVMQPIQEVEEEFLTLNTKEYEDGEEEPSNIFTRLFSKIS